MISKKTVLILGAGASKPYGFPTARELLVQLIAELRANGFSELYKNLVENKIMSAHFVEKFRRELGSSQPPSVDAFLENRNTFLEIGKIIMTAALIPKEKPEKLFPEQQQRWYEYLFDALGDEPGKLSDNKISIVTFNYDRSLEYALFLRLKNSYGLENDEVVQLMSVIPIIHLHGQIGELPWTQGGRDYTPEVDWSVISDWASAIRIVHRHENVDADPKFAEARRLLVEGEIICFVGFGYHPINMERLKLEALPKEAKLFGSTYGMKDDQINRVKESLPRGISLARKDADGLSFLRGYKLLK